MHCRKFVLLFVVACCTLITQAQQYLAPLPKSKNGFVVIAHRGNHVNVPENTIAAFEEAIKVGADYVEMDLRTTKDGYLILSHDGTVDRMTNGKGEIRNLTLEEVKKLQVTSPNKSDTKIYRIPEFTDVLKACKNRINIFLDFKDADVEETFRQIKSAGMEKQVVVYLNSQGRYRSWRQYAPDIPLVLSLPETIKSKEQLSFLLDQYSIEGFDNVRDSAMLTVTRENDVAVWLDIFENNPALWESLIQTGIQGISTDYPESLISYLNETKSRNGLTAFKANPEKAKIASVLSYRQFLNIPYSKEGNDNKDNRLDIYLPREYDNAKVIVYIHGGGWTGGDKSEIPKKFIEQLVSQRNYIVVSMNYRLVKDGKNRFPSQMEDVTTALSFLSANAEKYHFNGNEFALMGGSAGGHISMLYAYGYDPKKQVKTVVDFWGPTDLVDKKMRTENKAANDAIVNFVGTDDFDAQICKDASPYYRLTKETGVPTILFHGGEDPLVEVNQAEKMYKKLVSLNIPAQYELYPHEKHGVGGAAGVDVFIKTIAWLEKYYPSK